MSYRVYCHGRLVPVRILIGGYGMCLGCGKRIKVIS